MHRAVDLLLCNKNRNEIDNFTQHKQRFYDKVETYESNRKSS